MSNRAALRKLTRAAPDPQQVRDILEALNAGTDQSVAIVGAALLESTLEGMILHRLKASDPKLVDQLFENRGPLSDFSSKILIAVAFGIISPANGGYLHTVRHIRNAFAHSRVILTFSTPEIQSEVQSLLKVLEDMKGVYDAMVRAAPADWNLTEFDLNIPVRNAFRLIIQLLIIILNGQHQNAGGSSLYGADPLSKPNK